jgi:Ni/Fe-hydrogenase 1 B-type cytochrome subunit
MKTRATTAEDHGPTHIQVYVWELSVRLTHWIIALSILVLSVTGFYIGHPFIYEPGPAGRHFLMGTVRAVHLYAAAAFTAAVLWRLYWLFAGNIYARWSDFIPLSRRRIRSLWNAIAFYSFLRREPEEYPGHNAAAAASYAMIFAVYLLLIATGLALHAPNAPVGSPLRVFAALAPWFGGLPMARLIHHVLMWVVLIFFAMHLHFVMLSAMIERQGTFDSMITGHKFIRRKQASE